MVVHVLAAVAAVSAAKAGLPPTSGFLTGRVVTADGHPVSGATVSFGFSRSKPEASTKSGWDGRFTLGPLPAKAPSRNRHQDLYAEADGFARQYVRWPAVIPGASSDVGDIPLFPGQVYSGTVTDEKGGPLPGVLVQVEVARYGASHFIKHFGPLYETFTDAKGEYQTPPLPLGRHYLRTFGPGREQGGAHLRAHPTADAQLPPIVMEPEVVVAGRVVDDVDEKPIPGVQLNWSDPESPRTDADGRFVLHGFGPRARFLVLQVRKEGYLEGRLAVSAKDPVLRLKRTPGFAGRATDADTGAAVTVRSARVIWVERKPDGAVVPGSTIYSYLVKSEPGTFRVHFEQTGEFKLVLRADGYEDAELIPPEVASGTVIDGLAVTMRKRPLDFKPKPPATRVEGTATRGGKPVPTGWAVLYRNGGTKYPPALARGRTVLNYPYVYAEGAIRDGKFLLPVSRPGDDWLVVVYEPDRPPTFVGPVAVTAGEAKAVAVECPEPGSLSGTVPSWPIGWSGQLWVAAFSKTGFVAEARVGADGRFQFLALPPGDYGLKVGHDGFLDDDLPNVADPWTRAKRVSVSAGRAATGVELQVPEK